MKLLINFQWFSNHGTEARLEITSFQMAGFTKGYTCMEYEYKESNIYGFQ